MPKMIERAPDDFPVEERVENRTRLCGLGSFKLLCDFDWAWPKKLDRALVEELFTLRFVAEGANVVLLGPNGVGKTMLLKNLASRALHAGHSVLVRSASDLLADLAGQESSVARARRLRAYVQPAILCIDEVGYLSYDTRHTDLLFEVVTRRYDKNKSIAAGAPDHRAGAHAELVDDGRGPS
jgi:DNA replication protein DnaC